jgi:type II secretory pathway component HofQ
LIRRFEGGKFTFGYWFGEEPEPMPWNGGPPYTGEPLSISVKDADLIDVFALFRQFTGLEISTSKEVVGRKITLELVDVPWDQAFSNILQTSGLRAERWGNGWAIGPDPNAPAPDSATVTAPSTAR